MQLFISPLKPKQCQYSAVQYSAVQSQYVKICNVYFCINLDLTSVQHSQLGNIGYFQSSKLHPCHLVLCKWIQYLRNILPIYPIAPLSAICGFSESKSHF